VAAVIVVALLPRKYSVIFIFITEHMLRVLTQLDQHIFV